MTGGIKRPLRFEQAMRPGDALMSIDVHGKWCISQSVPVMYIYMIVDIIKICTVCVHVYTQVDTHVHT